MSRSHIGKTMFVSAALPETNDTAGFEALSWTPVAGLVQGPQFGYQHAMIEIPDLQTGRGSAVKGMGTGAESSMALKLTPNSDAGQELVKTIADGPQGKVSIKLVRGSGTGNAVQAGDPVEYAQGILHSYMLNAADGDSYEGFTVSFRQNAEHVTGTEPA